MHSRIELVIFSYMQLPDSSTSNVIAQIRILD